jgi:hypothetical protein
MPIRKFKNHKFETRNEESFKVQVFSFKRRQKTSRQKKLDQKLLPPKSKEYDKSVVPPQREAPLLLRSTIPLFSPIRVPSRSFAV